MSDTYVECLVSQKTSAGLKFAKILLIMLAAVFALLGVVLANLIGIGIGILCGVGAYFVSLKTELEFEYLYLDKEITVDKVIAKSKRKRAGVYEIERLEILAPFKSYHLDNYKNRQFSVKDYSIGYEEQPDRRYVMIYDGKEKLILSPSPEFVKAVANVAPRKVFTD